MKTAIQAAGSLMLCALVWAAGASAQTGPQPAPPPQAVPSAPGIIIEPPRSFPPPPAFGERTSSDDAQPQSCPATERKLELIV
jgi:hypothetical protein